MKFPIFASFIIFVLVLTRYMKKQGSRQEREEKSFWETERLANNVRKKSLEGLDYIRIPLDRLPVNALPGDATAADCVDTLRSLSEQKIVNLTGFTNTELKLEYGAPNISELTLYDQSYTLLACTLQKWADLLFEAGLFYETRVVLEFAVGTRTDVSKSYYMLAGIYSDAGETDKIKELAAIADTLKSVSRGPIVRTLKESYPSVC